MYRYSAFDRAFVHARAAQYRDQLRRHLEGSLADEEFKPLRLQNGWYIQRHAPMLRVAVPYGALATRQLRALADIAERFDRGYAHFTTRQNVQYNWIELPRSADVMDLLAEVDMHGIQTSGNCVRNITTDALAGVAPDEIADPRPYCEILRQWSTLHPEFAFLPRKFKIAVGGSLEDRVASGWYDIGMHLVRDGAGELGLRVLVGGGMGRTPLIGSVVREFLPVRHMLHYTEAILRVYNLYGRRDNLWKARIKILVRSEGQGFVDAVEREFATMLERDVGAEALLVTEAQVQAMAEHFEAPPEQEPTPAKVAEAAEARRRAAADPAHARWIARNVRAHRLADHRVVTLSLKRPGQAPGNATAQQMRAAAALAERFGRGELRVSH